ncbi:MAG: hypothetical protein HFJ52_03735 [Clostridia bacterium]|nr:hypothetical protein [Clostridia bacterium]
MKKLLKYIAVFIGLIIIYILLLALISLIPTQAIKTNVEKSAEELLPLGEKTHLEYLGKTVTLFNFTDALMINTAYSIEPDKPLYTAMIARRNYIPRNNN